MIVTSLQREIYVTDPSLNFRTRSYGNLPDKYEDLMKRCLNYDPDSRPDFTSVVRDLLKMTEQYDY